MSVEDLIQKKAEEEILLVTRQFVLPLWPKWLLAFLWIVLPFFLLFPLFQLQIVGVVVFFVLLFTGIVYVLRTLFVWHRSVFVVTDHRIVDHDQRGLFHRVVSQVPFRSIQDVSYDIHGFWPTIFRYGNISVEVKGNSVRLEMYRVYRPNLIHDLINDLCDEHGQTNQNLDE